MKITTTTLALTLALALAAWPLAADEAKKHDCPMHAAHQGHDVDRRGDAVMGFSHETTKHTFRLTKSGGAIEVRATGPKDAESIARIRTHLADIAKRFPKGDFAQPEEIHGRKPDGTDVMQELRAAIDWRYEPIERGGRVVVTTKDARALDAVHRFLRFQISDHRTGDPVEVE